MNQRPDAIDTTWTKTRTRTRTIIDEQKVDFLLFRLVKFNGGTFIVLARHQLHYASFWFSAFLACLISAFSHFLCIVNNNLQRNWKCKVAPDGKKIFHWNKKSLHILIKYIRMLQRLECGLGCISALRLSRAIRRKLYFSFLIDENLFVSAISIIDAHPICVHNYSPDSSERVL